MRSGIRRLLPLADKGLRLHAQCIGHAVDVVEVGDHLGGVMDGTVVEAVAAQRVEIGGHHGVRRVRQLDSKGAQGAIRSAEIGLPPVPGDMMNEEIGGAVVVQ